MLKIRREVHLRAIPLAIKSIEHHCLVVLFAQKFEFITLDSKRWKTKREHFPPKVFPRCGFFHAFVGKLEIAKTKLKCTLSDSDFYLDFYLNVFSRDHENFTTHRKSAAIGCFCSCYTFRSFFRATWTHE